MRFYIRRLRLFEFCALLVYIFEAFASVDESFRHCKYSAPNRLSASQKYELCNNRSRESTRFIVSCAQKSVKALSPGNTVKLCKNSTTTDMPGRCASHLAIGKAIPEQDILQLCLKSKSIWPAICFKSVFKIAKIRVKNVSQRAVLSRQICKTAVNDDQESCVLKSPRSLSFSQVAGLCKDGK